MQAQCLPICGNFKSIYFPNLGFYAKWIFMPSLESFPFSVALVLSSWLTYFLQGWLPFYWVGGHLGYQPLSLRRWAISHTTKPFCLGRLLAPSVHWVNLDPKGSLIMFQDQWRFGRMCNREQMLHLDIHPSASLCWPTAPVYPSWTHTSWLLSRCQAFV